MFTLIHDIVRWLPLGRGTKTERMSRNAKDCRPTIIAIFVVRYVWPLNTYSWCHSKTKIRIGYYTTHMRRWWVISCFGNKWSREYPPTVNSMFKVCIYTDIPSRLIRALSRFLKALYELAAADKVSFRDASHASHPHGKGDGCGRTATNWSWALHANNPRPTDKETACNIQRPAECDTTTLP